MAQSCSVLAGESLASGPGAQVLICSTHPLSAVTLTVARCTLSDVTKCTVGKTWEPSHRRA